MINESGRGCPYLGREALGQVAWVLSVDRAAEDALQDEPSDDVGRILGPQIERRHEDCDRGRYDDSRPASPMVGNRAPHGAAGEHDDVGPE